MRNRTKYGIYLASYIAVYAGTYYTMGLWRAIAITGLSGYLLLEYLDDWQHRHPK